MDHLKNAKEVEIPEEALQQVLESYDDSVSNKFLRFANRSPFLLAGILGFTTIGAIGVYKWRTRKIPMSLFLIQLRVAAQGTAIGCISVGMVYQMYKDFVAPKADK